MGSKGMWQSVCVRGYVCVCVCSCGVLVRVVCVCVCSCGVLVPVVCGVHVCLCVHS